MRLPAGCSKDDADEARRLLRYYGRKVLGHSREDQAAMSARQLQSTIWLAPRQLKKLRDDAGPYFRQRFNRPGSAMAADLLRWAVADLDREQGSDEAEDLPRMQWREDGHRVPAPESSRRGGGHSALGKAATRRGAGPVTAADLEAAVWRSVLHVCALHCLSSGAGSVFCLTLTVALMHRASRHCKDAGVSYSMFWAGVVIGVLSGRLGGEVAPDYTGKDWWSAAVETYLSYPDATRGAVPAVDGGGVDAESMSSTFSGLLPAERCSGTQRPDSVRAPTPVPCFMENPHGMLLKRPFMQCISHLMRVITYCSYGFLCQKRTCIWAFNSLWVGRPACKFRCFSCYYNHLVRSPPCAEGYMYARI
jgi:hypothetical protein